MEQVEGHDHDVLQQPEALRNVLAEFFGSTMRFFIEGDGLLGADDLAA
jgi:hypothetical protein